MSEFPSDWHRDQYVLDCEREIAGAERRVEELSAMDASEQDLADAQTALDNAKAELARVKKPAPKPKPKKS